MPQPRHHDDQRTTDKHKYRRGHLFTLPGENNTRTINLQILRFQAPTNLSCKSCSLPLCAIHLKPHRQVHFIFHQSVAHTCLFRPANTCLPFTVNVAEGVGRYVVATRDIAASEVGRFIQNHCFRFVNTCFPDHPGRHSSNHWAEL